MVTTFPSAILNASPSVILSTFPSVILSAAKNLKAKQSPQLFCAEAVK